MTTASYHPVGQLNTGREVSRRLKRAALVALGGTSARSKDMVRDLTIFPDDAFLTSFPRSGNTWLRFLIGNLIAANGVSFGNLEEIIPDIYVGRDWQLRKIARPRILKSHEPLDLSYGRVIYIVRDPRDVAVSYYHFQIKIHEVAPTTTLDDYVASFVQDGSSRFGSWGENVGGWLGARQGSPGFLLLKYEDMILDTEHELSRAVEFLGLEAPPERIAAAVASSSADAMRDSERKDGGKWETTRGTRQDIPFVRGATSGGWRDSLSSESAGLIESRWSRLMTELGYTTTA